MDLILIQFLGEDQLFEVIHKDGFKVYVQLNCVILCALIGSFIIVYGCLIKKDLIPGFRNFHRRNPGVFGIFSSGRHSSGLHFLRAVSVHDGVVLGVAETERFLEVHMVGIFCKEEVPANGVLTFILEVVVILKIFVLFIFLHELKIIKSLNQ